ncbi:MAG: hypothetical protein ACJ741_12265, partial [Pyrinomonadaceae bacterium]
PDSAPQPSAQPAVGAPGAAPPTSGGPYGRKFEPTETPMLLPETLEVSPDLQDGKWYPNVKFQIAYAGEARPRYKAEYFLPTGALWFSETLEKNWDGPFYLMQSAYDSEKAAKAIPTEGLFGIKITNMRDNSTAFQGKFRIAKFKQDGASGPKDVDYYVDNDWALPIGYTNVDWGEGKAEQGDPGIQMWFKGGIKTDDLEARLFYNGKQIATTDEGGSVNSVERRFPQHGGDNPSLFWQLLEFRWQSKLLFIGDDEVRNYRTNEGKLYINQMPGEYTVKVYYQGEQVRETKFKIADGDFAGSGVTLPNGLKTYRVILPVRVMGAVDKWNPARSKTEAFYGNPPAGLTP